MPASKAMTIVRWGLVAVFLANSLTAFFSPEEFSELLSGSFIHNLIPVSIPTFVMLIGVNDLLLALLMAFSRKWDTVIFIWASIWILGVMVALGRPLDILEESGFLAMAIALLATGRKKFDP
jgi:signal transduction histidine kinase